MEGLLPLVYKAIKKNRTRRQYECLSSGAAVRYDISMAEMYPRNPSHDDVYDYEHDHRVGHHDQANKFGHRRYNSVGEFRNGYFPSRIGASPANSKQLVRFRSHRHRLFSCITGA